MLQEFGPNLWVADGPPVSVLGPITMTTRTIVARLHDGSLWVNSPVALAPDIMAQLADIGPVRYLVAPTRLHVWRLPDWKRRFPAAQLWGPPDVTNPYRGIAFDGMLGDVAPPAWAADLDQVVFRGNRFLEEVEFFHRSSRTLIITDMVQHYPPIDGRPLRNAFMKAIGLADGGVPPEARATMRGRELPREALQRMRAWDFDNAIVAHGDNVTENAKAFVERAFAWLQSP